MLWVATPDYAEASGGALSVSLRWSGLSVLWGDAP